MSMSDYAKALGKRGGLERARRLSAAKKKKIASSGGKARTESLSVAKRIEENFRYLKAIHQMTAFPKARTSKNSRRKLPGIYV